MSFLRQLQFAFHLRKDAVFPFATTILAVLGGLLSIGEPAPWLVYFFGVIAVFTLSWAVFPVFRSLRNPYSAYFNRSSAGIKWLRACLGGKKCRLNSMGVEEVTVIGIACTDIGDLFHEVAYAIASGIRFKVVMLNPEHHAVAPNGILPRLERQNEVIGIVQKPLSKKLKKLDTSLEVGQSQIRQRLIDLQDELEDTAFASHRVCIRVCTDLWYLAEKLARHHEPSTEGGVEVFYRDEPPELRQWILDDRALLYSVYAASPGVGADNPMFLLSTLDGDAERFGQIAERAKATADEIIKHCKPAPPREPAVARVPLPAR